MTNANHVFLAALLVFRQVATLERSLRTGVGRGRLHGRNGETSEWPSLPWFSGGASAKDASEQGHALKSRPNILFFTTDSMDGRMVDDSHPESKAVPLPFLKGFFDKEGANFVRAYANNPMCVPSRSSMMTGRSSDRIDVYGNNQGLPASPDGVLDDMCVANYGEKSCRTWAKAMGYPETIFSAFQKLGYNIRAEGRLHVGGGLMNFAPHESSVEGKMLAQPFDPPTLDELTHYADVRVSGTNTMYTDMLVENGNGWPIPAQRPFAALDWPTVDHCRDFIRGLPTQADATRPFFLYCSFNLPHYEYATNSSWLKKVNDSLVTIPTWKKGFPKSWHPYDRFKAFSMGTYRDYSHQEIKKMRKIYYAMCAETDAMLSAVWSELRHKGYTLDNTYVMHISDHGEMKFEHRQMYKASMYEGSVRVPLQIAGPGIKKGQRMEHLTSLLDVFPTLLDMAQEKNWRRHARLQGKSLLAAAGADSVAPPSMKLHPEDDRDFVFSQYSWLFSNTGAFMARSGPWKYVTFGRTFSAFKDYKPQLFNVEEDPEELHDVAASHPETIKLMDAKLRVVVDPDEVDKRMAKLNFERVTLGMNSTKDFTRAANFSFVTFNMMKGFECEDKALSKLHTWFKEATTLFGKPFGQKKDEDNAPKSLGWLLHQASVSVNQMTKKLGVQMSRPQMAMQDLLKLSASERARLLSSLEERVVFQHSDGTASVLEVEKVFELVENKMAKKKSHVENSSSCSSHCYIGKHAAMKWEGNKCLWKNCNECPECMQLKSTKSSKAETENSEIEQDVGGPFERFEKMLRR